MIDKKNLKLFLKTEWVILILSLLFVSIIAKVTPNSSEIFCRTFSRSYTYLTGWFFKYIPFSLTELFFVSMVLGLLYLFITFFIDLKHKRKEVYKKKALNFVILILLFSTIYNATCGVAYVRNRVNLPMYNEIVDKDQFEEIAYYYLDDFNYCASQLEFREDGEVINPYKLKELNKIIEKDMKILDEFDCYSKFTTRAKPMLSSFLYRELNITGIFFGPCSESNIDYLMTNAERPFTMTHELTHAKGILNEEDAQLTAMYVTLNSDNVYLRYSNYIWTFYSLFNLMNYTGKSNSYNKLYWSLNENIRKNYTYISEYWKKHDLLSKISDFFNDLYLKIEGDKDGTDSYSPSESSENIGTSEKPVIVIKEFSSYQKMYFYNYFVKRNNTL